MSSFQQEAVARGVVAVSTNADGVPRLVRAVRKLPSSVPGKPADAAIAHLAALAPAYIAKGESPADVEVEAVHALRNGATVVELRQEAADVEVLHGGVRVLLDRDGALIAIGGTPRVAAGAKPRAFKLTAPQAYAKAVTTWFGIPTSATDVIRGKQAGKWQHLTMGPRTDLIMGDAHAKQVLAPDGKQLVAAWLVEGYGSSKQHREAAFRLVLAADDGRVLERKDLVAKDAFDYRVWADDEADGTDGRPFEGPHESFAPHPTGVPDGSRPAYVAPNLVSMDSFNAPGDSWLADDATETVGNNADAYVDLFNPGSQFPEDGLTAGDFRADLTDLNEFDRTYDVDEEPDVSVDQQKAGITQLFYTVNWLHDWYYDSGFTEVGRNAQASNLGRGGLEGDVLLAEAQDDIDGGSMNNANMATPQDGLSPRMQMFVWSGVTQSQNLTVSGLSTDVTAQGAQFGPQTFSLAATEIVLADDGNADPSAADGCEPLVNDVAGKIVLLDEWCFWEFVVQNAEAAGAVGALVAGAEPGRIAPMAWFFGTPISIPSFGISYEDGVAIKALLQAGPTTASLDRVTGPRLDGDLDTGVIAHEFGHYFHHRLTDCFTYQCAAESEGWGDFLALQLQYRPGDDLDGAYAFGAYDTWSFADPYYGIRRAPYSRDMDLNGATFRHIMDGEPLPPTHLDFGNNAEVHNAGEVWATMLWEVYVALLDAHDYDIARRAMSDYIVGGLLVAPPGATYTETRDAILAAIDAIEPDDTSLALAAFSKRGAGSCAVSPSPDDFSLSGVVESYETSGALAIGTITITDDVVSCDTDGILDPGETATVTVEVANSGHAPLTGTVVTLQATDAAPGQFEVVQPTVTVASLAPLASTTVTFQVRFDPAFSGPGFELVALAENDDACITVVGGQRSVLTDFDDVAGVSATETADSAIPVWGETGDFGDETWNRLFIGAPVGWVWHGADQGFQSDTQLVTPPLDVHATDAFGVSFLTVWEFETDFPPPPDGPIFWDGGVIEVSDDDGATWVDITDVPGVAISLPYNGTINGFSGNPLDGRDVYTHYNPATIAAGDFTPETITIDFGTAFAGETVQLRWRIGTDFAVERQGWFLDDLAFTGITNTPFGAVSPEGPTCQAGPNANAGPDAIVVPGNAVLDGTLSSDPNGDPLTYAWVQTGGLPVTLTNATTATPSFTAPDGSVDLRLTFRLTVADPWASDTDTVIITVDVDNTPPPIVPDAMPAPDAGPDAEEAPDAEVADFDAEPAPDAEEPVEEEEDDGGCCSTGGGMPTTGALAPLFALAFVLRRRRR